jgi:hypothetical protein
MTTRREEMTERLKIWLSATSCVAAMLSALTFVPEADQSGACKSCEPKIPRRFHHIK